MRTAAICPTCATYENALCILYNGSYLSNIDVAPLDSVEDALVKINDNLIPRFGVSAPTAAAVYLGQLYVKTSGARETYCAKTTGNGAIDWKILLSIPNTGTPEFADNAAAIAGGLLVGEIYRTGDVLKIVH